MLDHMSDGRMILGLGRGLGRVEFEGFGVKQEDARELFVESAQMILEGLERGYCEFDGKFVQQTRRNLRPRPFKSFRGRTYAAAVSPESSEISGAAWYWNLIIPQSLGRQSSPSSATIARYFAKLTAPMRLHRSWADGLTATRTRIARRRWRESISVDTGTRSRSTMRLSAII